MVLDKRLFLNLIIRYSQRYIFCYMLINGNNVQNMYIFSRNAVLYKSLINLYKSYYTTYILLTGLPGVIAISWAIAMHLTMETSCWQNNSQSPYSYIVSGSILLALAVRVKCKFLYTNQNHRCVQKNFPSNDT